MPCSQSIVSIPRSGGNSCSTFSFSGFGYHLGRPLHSLLLPGVFTTCVENHYPLIWFSRSFFLLSLTFSLFRRCRLSAEMYLDGASTFDMELSPLLVVLKNVMSLFASPS